MALPGNPRRAPIFATWKVSIGEKVFSGNGRSHPAADDRITIRYYESGRDTWLVSAALQGKLQEVTAQDKPQWCPFYSPYNNLDQAIFSELAAWASSNRNVCRCGNWEPKPEELCRAQGLEWPPPNGWEMADDEYYIGTATRTIWDQSEGFPLPLEQRQMVCDPHTCPFRQGRWDKDGRAQYEEAYGKPPSQKTVREGTVYCNPHTVMPMLLPFRMNNSPRAKFSTPSWYSGMALQRTWLEIRDMCGGFIQGIPLKLVLEFPKIRTPRGMQHVGLVHIAPLVPYQDLPALAEAKSRELTESVVAQQALRSHMKMLDGIVEEDARHHVGAFVTEHDLPADEPTFRDEAERRFRALAKRIPQPWTDNAIASFLAEASQEALYEMLGGFEEQLGMCGPQVEAAQEPGAKSPGPIDVEYEDEVQTPAPGEDDEPNDHADECFPQELQEPAAEAYDDPPVAPYEDVDELPADYAEVFPEAPEVQQAAARPKQQKRTSTKPQRMFTEEVGRS